MIDAVFPYETGSRRHRPGRVLVCLVVAVAIGAPCVDAARVNVAETGQKTSFAPGDDGEVRSGIPWPSPRFTHHGDGTVTDNLTGLMWLRDASCWPRVTWQTALGRAAQLNTIPADQHCEEYTASYADWRTPNINELESLMVHLGEHRRRDWLQERGFRIDDEVQIFYSSTSVAGEDTVWAAPLESAVQPLAKHQGARAWPVRGGTQGDPDRSYPANVRRTGQVASVLPGDDGELRYGVDDGGTSRLIDLGDGTVRDTGTGLIWLKDAGCLEMRDWPDALATVREFNSTPHSFGCADYSANFEDWRLPSIHEYRTLVDHSRHDPALPENHPFRNVRSRKAPQADFYWSSSANPNGGIAYFFPYLGQPESYGTPGRQFHVWAVRGGSAVFRFVAMADSRSSEFPTQAAFAEDGINTGVFRPALEEIRDLRPASDLIVFAGDLALGYGDGAPSNLLAEQLQAWKSLVNVVLDHAGASGNYADRLVLPVFGSHERDYIEAATAGWTKYDLAFPKIEKPATDPSGRYLLDGACKKFDRATFASTACPDGAAYGATVYYCDYENARFFVLNNDADPYAPTAPGYCYETKVWQHEIGVCQQEWLASNLSRSCVADGSVTCTTDADCATVGGLCRQFFFVAVHEPAFGVGAHYGRSTDYATSGWLPLTMDCKADSRDRFVKLLAENGVSLLFSGHEHHYTRRYVESSLTALQGTTRDFLGGFHELKVGSVGAKPKMNTFPEFMRGVEVGPLDRFHYAVVDVYEDFVAARVHEVDGAVFDQLVTGAAEGLRDLDGDGVPGFEEGTENSASGSVTRVESATAAGGVTIEILPIGGASPVGTLRAVDAISDEHGSLASDPPDGAVFPFGMIRLDVTGIPVGSSVPLRLTFPFELPTDFQYWKYLQLDQDWAAVGSPAVDGRSILLTLRDGGPGDGDKIADGKIRDPGGFAIVPDSMNPYISFSAIPSSFALSMDTAGCPDPVAAVYRFEARLQNRSDRALYFPRVRVALLGNGNQLLNADGGPAGVGATLTLRRTGDNQDGVLDTGETMDVPFAICLGQIRPFPFYVNVEGKAD